MPRRTSRARKQAALETTSSMNNWEFPSDSAAQSYIDDLDAQSLAAHQYYLACERENELKRKQNAEKSWCQWFIDILNYWSTSTNTN